MKKLRGDTENFVKKNWKFHSSMARICEKLRLFQKKSWRFHNFSKIFATFAVRLHRLPQRSFWRSPWRSSVHRPWASGGPRRLQRSVRRRSGAVRCRWRRSAPPPRSAAGGRATEGPCAGTGRCRGRCSARTARGSRASRRWQHAQSAWRAAQW